MKHEKIFAIALAVFFCASAFAIVIDSGDESSGAYTPKVYYDFYIQLNDGTNSKSVWLDTASVEGTGPTAANMATALNQACTAAGMAISLSGNWVNSITADKVTYETQGTYQQEGYKSFALYYLKDDNTWAATSTYDESFTFAIVYDEYKFTDPQDSKKYLDSGFGYWTVLPDIEWVDYHIYLQLNDGTNSYSKWLPTISEPNISKASLSKAVKAACEKEGITTDYAAGWANSFTADGVTYASKGTYQEPGYMSFAQYYEAASDKWGSISTYNESSTVAIVYDEYKFTDPQDSSKYYDSGFGYWTVLPDVDPSDATAKKANNIGLYIGIGAVAVIAVVAIAFFVIKKK